MVNQGGQISTDELLSFLSSRQDLLDGVVLSGGECSLYGGLKPLCKEIKGLGFDIKLDTNGSNPKVLQELLEDELIDFVSLDFKANEKNFLKVTKSNLYSHFIKSLEILQQNGVDFEVRTTVHSSLHMIEDLNEMIGVIKSKGYDKTYFLQNFLEVKTLGGIENSKGFDFSGLRKDLAVEFRNF